MERKFNEFRESDHLIKFFLKRLQIRLMETKLSEFSEHIF